MARKKIVCLGGGSFYFRRVMADLPLSQELAGGEVVLYDIDFEKARRMAAMGARLSAEAGGTLKVRAARSLSDAVDGADFALSSIGASGAGITQNVYDSYFHNADVRIAARYGIQQVIGDTCGPAGLMMGLRSVPVYLKIAKEMEKRSPKVIMFNHSNPMAVICRAMAKYTSIKTIGICHGVQHGVADAAKILGLPANELEMVWVGTNHYYWVIRISHKGRDLYPKLKKLTRKGTGIKGQVFSNALSKIYGYHVAYGYDSHTIEFYPFLAQVASQDKLPYGLKDKALTHGFDASKPMPKYKEPTKAVRQKFFRQYQRLLDETELPERMDDSITSEGMATLLGAIATGRRQTAIVNIPNSGAVTNLPAHALVEVEAVTDSLGVRPMVMGEAPPVLKGILEKRFAWQELAADAAATGDRRLALEALMVDEQAILPEKAEAMMAELLEASKPLLPQFKF